MFRLNAKASLAAAAALPLAACSAAMEDEPRVEAPAAVAVGEPVNCIQTSRIQNLRIHDDYTIDFVTTNGQTYRNTLPNRCPGLGFDRRIQYETRVGQLCSSDTFTVLNPGGINGPVCGLGQFVPVRIADQ